MVSKIGTFEQFLAGSSVEISISKFVLALVLVAICAHILGRFYVRYGTSLSNREKFAKNFLLLAATTTLIITIVKSSLALSLGLVGALSIVRFRAAIKEPEELLYLFLVIALGLGFGAYQFLITLVAFALILILVFFKEKATKKSDIQNLGIIISGESKKNLSVEKISALLKEHCTDLILRRFDTNKDNFEISFFVQFSSFNKLVQAKNALRKLDPQIEISYLERK